MIINLDVLTANVESKNLSSSYMPVRTNYNECDWNAVSGLFVSSALGIEIKKYSAEQFEEDCEKAFKDKLSEESFWNVLKKTYFENQDLFKVAPHCLLLNANKEKTTAADQRVATVLDSLLGEIRIEFDVEHHLNFIEKIIISTLKAQLVKKRPEGSEPPYLPFLADCLQQDILFLAKNPKYMLEELPHFLALYTFLYTSQLALNLPEWEAGPPKPKPLYFILDTEKASSERTEIKNYGWESFTKAAHDIFPMLSMMEALQLPKTPKKPLWKIASELRESSDTQYTEHLKDYTLRFKDERGIKREIEPAENSIEWLRNLLRLACDQFDKAWAKPGSDRPDINSKIVRAIEKYIAEGFVQNRRRGGNVLVLNQDTLLLLTNISIGSSERLRLVELIEAFEQRGVFFDKQSQLRLVDFYERIGNVERMSDSGEAVYVRKTI
ncbi:DNA phosphorothioation-dependent restriction protein DptG [Neptunomonas qingdaonensis]|uniref:DNA phosphorothioation-dependent restriction protein DptG n=1 Tax=Neptunomonas qingdaonensis TaxID=1045558 RepID=A0A1I2U2I0_9GAMM|nr:DNA phosphorothioation-dependent restriction protein DptG [Neptunomonas qingdaonensis]SFG68781.1 DNA phosphorothioation-dependent restriction protein DptG [Neptunomonas qingdaonensis]